MTRTKIFCAPLFLLALSARVSAQAPTVTPTPAPAVAPAPAPTVTPTPAPVEVKAARAPRAEADPLAEQRRMQAVSMLTSLANDAAIFRDQALRARAQARAADALWAADSILARILFRRAWGAADAADREARRKMDEEVKAQLARGGGAALTPSPPDLRAEVLRLVARRDRALAEEMLAMLAKSFEESDVTSASAGGGTGDTSQRLRLAWRLLDGGDVEHALQFAEPALGRAEVLSVAFLCALRNKDAATADRLYAALVARAAADPGADANTASVISSYVFSPLIFAKAQRLGRIVTDVMGPDRGPLSDIAPALRASALRAAARMLLRPQTVEEYDGTSAGRAGTYVIIRRMLPLFEQYAPDLTAALNARAAALLPDVPEETRRREAEGRLTQTPGREEEGAGKDSVQEALDRAERTAGVAERDAIYAQAAVEAAWKGDPRAQELLDKINDSELAQRARKFADFGFVRAALRKNDVEAAVARASKGELRRVERAWAFQRAAALLYKTDRARAVALLEEAAAEARRIDNTDPDRARALVAVATLYEKIDRPRAWDFISEAARAANSAPAFTGEDGKLFAEFKSSQGGWMTDFRTPEFDLPGIIATFAAEDWNRAVQLTESFTGEAARATAVIAAARAALNEKRK